MAQRVFVMGPGGAAVVTLYRRNTDRKEAN
jgi:hypothetical protein